MERLFEAYDQEDIYNEMHKYREALEEISSSPHGTDHCKLKAIADKALHDVDKTKAGD